MDLYMQIGLVFAVMTAFASFIFIFNTPADMFVTGSVESQQEIENRVKAMDSLGIAHLLNNPNVAGSEVDNIIRDAKSRKLSVLLQSKAQGGLVVNYGYQLRSANTDHVFMGGRGVSKYSTDIAVGNIAPGLLQDEYGSDFEKNFVTSVSEIFMSGVAFKADANISITSNILLKIPFRHDAFIRGLAGYSESEHQKFIDYLNGTDVSYYDNSYRVYTPKLYLYNRTSSIDYTKAVDIGRTFSSTGFMYTPDSIKTNMPVNTNFSYLDDKGSLYKLNKSASFYSTLILGDDGEIKGVYFEEHGVHHGGAVLGRSMLVNGTISQIY